MKQSSPPSELVYPSDYLARVGYHELLAMISSACHNSMGIELVQHLRATSDAKAIRLRFQRVEEMTLLLGSTSEIPSLALLDLRSTLAGLQAEGSYLLEEDLPQLCQAIDSYLGWSQLLGRKMDTSSTGAASSPYLYPTLSQLAPPQDTLREIVLEIQSKLDSHGKLKDSASPRLAEIRTALQSELRSIARTMRRLMSAAQSSGFVAPDAQPSIRSGRPVLPVTAMHKRQIPGIVHDESASGKTLYIEPLEVVEVNNRIRELESDERREIINILRTLSEPIRLQRPTIERLYLSMGRIDALVALSRFAQREHCAIPELCDKPALQWLRAEHPLLRANLVQEGKQIVPQDIELQAPNQRILLISGPNAGGKSVCLKTVALLQYMIQAGIPVPLHPDSVAGVFRHLSLEIGDNQSIEDDLSTYSSHLRHMRVMAAQSGPNTLLLIDEFGAGTEPELGGAIAEGLLDLFNRQHSWGIITTHYRNLKEYASAHEGVINGAMLYDRGQMKPLFQLSIGQPGSSFALEIARQQGLPVAVTDYATERLGEEVVQSDRYVQDIVRDKQYWQRKRNEIHQQEKKLQSLITNYEAQVNALKEEKKNILANARQEATTLLADSRAHIERTIREIKESQADRLRTREIRQELESFTDTLSAPSDQEIALSEKIEREMERIRRRQERKKNQGTKLADQTPTRPGSDSSPLNLSPPAPPKIGDEVRIISMNQIGRLVNLSPNSALVLIQDKLRVTVKPGDIVSLGSPKKSTAAPITPRKGNITEHLHKRRLEFSEQLDVRGMRSAEALQAVQYYLDDALSLGYSRVQILHGTGTGALRVAIRDLLSSFPGVVRYHDEDVRYGGAGITIVHLQ